MHTEKGQIRNRGSPAAPSFLQGIIIVTFSDNVELLFNVEL